KGLSNIMQKKYALISVYNKANLEKIAPTLNKLGYTIISTEGTGAVLKKLGIDFIPASEITKNPDALHDCIQTISYAVSGGILFDRANELHISQVNQLNIKSIDIVICNFPPLEEVVRSEDEFNIKHVDVGGPLMLRSAATNYKWVLPI